MLTKILLFVFEKICVVYMYITVTERPMAHSTCPFILLVLSFPKCISYAQQMTSHWKKSCDQWWRLFMVGISISDRTDSSSLCCQAYHYSLSFLWRPWLLEEAAIWCTSLISSYSTVCAIISICRHLTNATRNAIIMHFVINEHDIMGVKISLVCKQCVPDLRFPPMQNTKALRRWYFNAFTTICLNTLIQWGVFTDQ